MPAYVWNGSAWKKVLRKTMWTGTAWKDIKSSHRWTGSTWETIYSSFSAVGMTKNGDQQLASGSTWIPITAWTPDANSTVTGNALQVKGSGTATIEVGSAWTVLGTANKDWRVLKNGVVVWIKGASTGQTFTHSFSLAVVDGDLLTVEGWNNSGVAANRTIASGSGTYLRVVPA